MGKSSVSCCIADQHCLAPDGYRCGGRSSKNTDLPKSLPRCTSCGEPVCLNCSHTKNKLRYCADCLISNFGLEAEVTTLAKIYRLSGYKNSRKLARADINRHQTE